MYADHTLHGNSLSLGTSGSYTSSTASQELNHSQSKQQLRNLYLLSSPRHVLPAHTNLLTPLQCRGKIQKDDVKQAVSVRVWRAQQAETSWG